MEDQKLFEFILIDEFSMTSVVTAIEPLRMANRILGQERYAWRMVQEDGPVPAASNRLTLPCGRLDPSQDEVDYTFVCAGLHTDLRHPSQIYALLNRRAGQGAFVGGISMGAAILARAGLLQGRRAVIHWEGLAPLTEEFPEIELSPELYLIDGPVITSSGGLATVDLFLEILGKNHESWLVQAVANQLQVARPRAATDRQSTGTLRLPETAPMAMHKAVALIDQNIEHPMTLDTLADAVGASRRTLERQFKAMTGVSLGAFYMDRRLEQAKHLMLHSNMSILEIGIATGFHSNSHFAERFRRAVGQTPRRWREANQ